MLKINRQLPCRVKTTFAMGKILTCGLINVERIIALKVRTRSKRLSNRFKSDWFEVSRMRFSRSHQLLVIERNKFKPEWPDDFIGYLPNSVLLEYYQAKIWLTSLSIKFLISSISRADPRECNTSTTAWKASSGFGLLPVSILSLILCRNSSPLIFSGVF